MYRNCSRSSVDSTPACSTRSFACRADCSVSKSSSYLLAWLLYCSRCSLASESSRQCSTTCSSNSMAAEKRFCSAKRWLRCLSRSIATLLSTLETLVSVTAANSSSAFSALSALMNSAACNHISSPSSPDLSACRSRRSLIMSARLPVWSAGCNASESCFLNRSTCSARRRYPSTCRSKAPIHCVPYEAARLVPSSWLCQRFLNPANPPLIASACFTLGRWSPALN